MPRYAPTTIAVMAVAALAFLACGGPAASSAGEKRPRVTRQPAEAPPVTEETGPGFSPHVALRDPLAELVTQYVRARSEWEWYRGVLARREEARRAVTVPAVAAAVPAVESSGRCGGDLPPCSVMYCESGGNIRAENPHSTASGKWQFLDSTWAGHGGYARAKDAPESVQDERARQVYAGGAGRGHWVC